MTEDPIIGKKIAKIRKMTQEEMEEEYWGGMPPVVLELEDGTVIIPSQDYEGNGPGALFVVEDGKMFSLVAN